MRVNESDKLLLRGLRDKVRDVEKKIKHLLALRGILNENISFLAQSHPEKYCDKCGSLNPSWHAPNDLWNKVTGHPAGLVICPMCFQRMAKSIGKAIHFIAEG